MIQIFFGIEKDMCVLNDDRDSSLALGIANAAQRNEGSLSHDATTINDCYKAVGLEYSKVG
jgi:hypothetical protein